MIEKIAHEYLLQHSHRTQRPKICKLFKAVMVRSYAKRKFVAFVIKDVTKVASSILQYLRDHDECFYFKAGYSYNQITLVSEMYYDICGLPTDKVEIPHVLRSLASHIKRRKSKPFLIIDGMYRFKRSKLYSWLKNMSSLWGICGIVIILTPESVEDLRNYEKSKNRGFGVKEKHLDEWYFN